MLVFLEFGGELDLAAGEDAEIAGPILIAGETERELMIAGRDLECGRSGAGKLAIEINFGAGGIGSERDGGRGGIGLSDGDELAVFDEDDERGVVQPGLRFEAYFALWSAEDSDDLFAGHPRRKRGWCGRCGSWNRSWSWYGRGSGDGGRRGWGGHRRSIGRDWLRG